MDVVSTDKWTSCSNKTYMSLDERTPLAKKLHTKLLTCSAKHSPDAPTEVCKKYPCLSPNCWYEMRLYSAAVPQNQVSACDRVHKSTTQKVLPSRKLAANPSDVTDAANFVTPDFASKQLPDCTKLPRFATRCLRSLCRNVLVTSL